MWGKASLSEPCQVATAKIIKRGKLRLNTADPHGHRFRNPNPQTHADLGERELTFLQPFTEGFSPKHGGVDLDGFCTLEEERATPERVNEGWQGLGLCPFHVQDPLVGL